MTAWEIISRKIPFSEFSEFLERREETLSEDQMKDDELMKSLSENGFEIVGSTAVKESYKVGGGRRRERKGGRKEGEGRIN
jgi:hypothetical protein